MNVLIWYLSFLVLVLYLSSRNLGLLADIIEKMTILVIEVKTLWFVVTQWTPQEKRDEEERESTKQKES